MSDISKEEFKYNMIKRLSKSETLTHYLMLTNGAREAKRKRTILFSDFDLLLKVELIPGTINYQYNFEDFNSDRKLLKKDFIDAENLHLSKLPVVYFESISIHHQRLRYNVAPHTFQYINNNFELKLELYEQLYLGIVNFDNLEETIKDLKVMKGFRDDFFSKMQENLDYLYVREEYSTEVMNKLLDIECFRQMAVKKRNSISRKSARDKWFFSGLLDALLDAFNVKD